MNCEPYNATIAFSLARVILGILFLMQGYDKVFKVKIKNVVQSYEVTGSYPFSNFFVWTGTIFTSWAEIVGGLLLILGLFTNYALWLLGLDMIAVVLAFSAMNPVWDMKFVFPRLALLIFLLAIPSAWNLFSIDHCLFTK